MTYDLPVDYQVLIDNKCAGSNYAVYLYIKNRLIANGMRLGLSVEDIKHGYDPTDYEGLIGISRDEIRDDTQLSLKQVKKSLDNLKDLELVVPDNNDNGRYHYQIHFRLPFLPAC